MTIAILADDLTGACDAAAPFARHGLATQVLLAPRPAPAARPGSDLAVVSLDADTRRLSRRLAVARTMAAAHALRAGGATLLFRKIDSTLRGHVGPEVLACMRAWEAPLAIVCPSFPAMGRWVQNGNLFVDGRGKLGEVASLARLPIGRRTVRLGLETVGAGAEAVTQALDDLARHGARVVVVDANTPLHLSTLVEASVRRQPPVLLAGSAGLASALAGWAAGPDSPLPMHAVPASAPEADPAGPPWLVVVGSQTEVSQHQVVELARAGACVLELDVDELLTRRAAEQAGRRAVAFLHETITPVLRLVVSPNAEGMRSRGPRLDDRAARALGRACRVALEAAGRDGIVPGGLFLTGGLTARACLLELGAAGLRLEREPLPGIAAGRAVGGRWDGRQVITKAGGFGAPDAIRRLVRPRSARRPLLAVASDQTSRPSAS
ncbi:MAG: four-carbon acid sugar kinase family protein [Chloroflexi bacterium]|nr:four-carbon acid sugar kinase family protein [Chloroflexota bacterium]